MANQYTSAEELGFPGKAERSKDAVRAELLSQRLEQFINGKIELTSAQVQAAKILIDKGKPNLSSVEQTGMEDTEHMSEEELAAKIRSVAKGKPELLSKILGDIARAQLKEVPKDKDGAEKVA